MPMRMFPLDPSFAQVLVEQSLQLNILHIRQRSKAVFRAIFQRGEIVSASISAGVSNAKSSTTGTSYTYSHPISNGKYGNLQWVNWAATVSVKKTVVVSPCNFSQIAAGTATVPRDSWGYRYWEN